jgi:hypothetical protein
VTAVTPTVTGSTQQQTQRQQTQQAPQQQTQQQIPQQPSSSGGSKIPDAYRDAILATMHDLVTLAKGKREDGWSAVGLERGIAIAKKASGQFHCFKGTGLIKAPAQVVKALVEHFVIGKTDKWDKLLTGAELLENIDSNTRVYHLLYETRKCLANVKRDFCILSHWNQLKDGTIIGCARSTKHPKCPENSNITRGEVLASGYLIKPVENKPEHSVVVYVTQVDLGGLPSLVVNFVGAQQPIIVARVRDILEKGMKM